MVNPFGPALINIFFGYYESKRFNKISKPTVYRRYVDNTFSFFHGETDFKQVLTCHNSLHSSVKFINDVEANNSLPFFYGLFTKSNDSFITSIYRKPTFTGQYIHWDSFGAKQPKTNLFVKLTHRALKICSKSIVEHEPRKQYLLYSCKKCLSRTLYRFQNFQRTFTFLTKR